MPFEDFYTLYRPYVARVVHAVVKDASPEQVEDLVQDTFLRAWKAYERLAPGAEKAWISCIARNVAIDYWRSRRVQQRSTCIWDAALIDTFPTPASAAQVVSNGETESIKQVLACLRQKDRDVLLFVSQGYQAGEIADHLGLTVACCKMRVMRARERFRRQYLALEGCQ